MPVGSSAARAADSIGDTMAAALPKPGPLPTIGETTLTDPRWIEAAVRERSRRRQERKTPAPFALPTLREAAPPAPRGIGRALGVLLLALGALAWWYALRVG